MDDNEIKELIWLFALKNAIKFDGKPNKKAIMGKLMAEKKELRSKAKELLSMIEDIITELSKLSVEEQKERLLELDPTALEKKQKKEEKKELPELPNHDKYEKIVMRLAPYPSGALHIGNARMIVLNDEYVKRYGGELILFYDDTIGSPKSLRGDPKAKYVLPEAYDLIEEGLKWLGVNYSKIYYKSDRLEIYYEYCEKLIRDNMAYVCFCTANEFRDKYKLKMQDCPHRNQTIEKNLEEWHNMLNRKYGETEAVVRLKTGMDQQNPALRDQIIMRISEAEHPRVGNKYVVWPMLEFSWAIDDHLLGITHILRGIDLVKEDIIEEFIWEHFKWPKAEFLHYGRLRFPEMKLSKTLAREKIKKGEYRGWDDPRTWSLQSLAKRGIRPEALRETLLDLGMSQTGITFSVDWLYSKNKEIIDEISNRYFYVENPILLKIKDVEQDEYIAKPLLLPTHPEKGAREIHLRIREGFLEVYIAESDLRITEEGKVIRLKDLLNVEIVMIDRENNVVFGKFHSSKLNREFSIIHWVPADEYIQVSILKPDGEISRGFGEINLLDIPLNNTIQFERYGFVNPVEIKDNELFCYFTH